MNQGKLEVVKQEMARVNVDILGISKLKWTGWVNVTQMNVISTTERKVMTNLDSILKSRDITLSTKVRVVKAMVFPVVVYGCESWTVKRLSAKELRLLNCGVGEDS